MLKDWLTRADSFWGIRCGEKRREMPFLTWSPIPKLKVIIRLEVKHCLSMSAIRPSVTFLGSLTFLSLKRNCIGSYWWFQLWILSWNSSVGHWRRFTLNGIEHQVWASWTTLISCSSGGLQGMHCTLPTRLSKWTWQTCLIASTAAVAWTKWLRTPSTTASGFTHFGVKLGSEWPSLIINSLCCSTLVDIDNVDPLY